MRITKVELRNWGPHEHLLLETDDPVVGIIGSNGAGKSNLLQAINYALTGNLNKRNGTSYIRNFGMEGGATFASVAVEFVSGEKEGRIYREIGAKSTKRELTWDGQTYKKADEVKSALRTALGADDAALASAVFILQGEIANLVKGTPSERHEIFRKLMNLNFVDARSNDIQSKIEALRAGVKDYTGEKEVLEDQLTDIADDLEELDPHIKDTDWVPDALLSVKLAQPLLEKRRDTQVEIDNETRRRVSLVEELTAVAEGKTFSEWAADYLATKVARDFSNDQLKTLRRKEALEESMAETKLELRAAKANFRSKYPEHESTEEEITEMLSGLLKDAELYANLVRIHEERVSASAVLAEAVEALDRKEEEYEAFKKEWDDAIEKLAVFKLEKDPVIDAMRWKVEGIRLRLRAYDGADNTVCPCCGQTLCAENNRTREELYADELETTNRMTALMSERKSITDVIDNAKVESRMYERSIAQAVDALAAAQKVVNDASTAFWNLCTSAGLPPDESIDYTDTAKDKWDTYKATAVAYKDFSTDKKWIERLEADITDARTKLDGLHEVPDDEDTLVKRVERLDKELQDISVKKDRVQRLENDIVAIDNKLVALNEKYEKLWSDQELESKTKAAVRMALSTKAGIEGNELSLVCISEAKDELTSLSSAREVWMEQWNTLIRKQTEADEKLQEIEEKIERNAVKEELIRTLEKVRQLVGKNGAPLAYMESVFNGIVAIVQDLLTKMGANFTVEADPENPVSFVFTRLDNDTGYTMPQEQLSGGQAIRLALALLIASQQVILPDVGLLVLDEPSSHIDAEGVEQMRDMLSDLSVYLQSAHMQIIMVDHNDTLIGAVDNTIQL